MLRLKLILFGNLSFYSAVNNVGGDETMNLLNYTKTLYNRINMYDKFLKATNFECCGGNPFNNKKFVNLTVIWAEDMVNNKADKNYYS